MLLSCAFAFALLNFVSRGLGLSRLSHQHTIHNFDPPIVSFSNSWSLLGPFQIGTREAAWGADPLECYGGFSNLQPDNTASFKSSLATNGAVAWINLTSKARESTASGAKVSLSVGFPDIDWAFLQSVYGWAALQWQAWARGEIHVSGDVTQNFTLYTDSILEYAVDGVRAFGGDFYSFRKAPIVLHLKPGKHIIDLRLVRDVRAMGGVGFPTIDINLEVRVVPNGLEVASSQVIVSDVVDGRLASPYGTVTVRNNGKDWVEVYAIADAKEIPIDVRLVGAVSKTIGPGQTRPVVFHISIKGNSTTGSIPDKEVTLSYRNFGEEKIEKRLQFTIKLQSRSIYEPHKVTHLHPGDIVSYAMLRAPAKTATCEGSDRTTSAPILLQFHGAGVDADNSMVAHALDPVPELCAWVLFPSGVTSWSGDDWHNWGFTDVEAAVHAIPAWIEATAWRGVGVDTDKWFVSGHSNGGQGTWYALLHHPDKVFAAAPVSGYLSIHTYVPYQFWKPMDPRRRAVIEASANSYHHELLASNAKGIPIYQQHGSADDNVPAYHSRLMSQLLTEADWPSNYSELSGKGHWFETVMTTSGLQSFYRDQLKILNSDKKDLLDFELVVANPADTGSKSGVEVLYLMDPGQIGKVRVSLDLSRSSALFTTSNIFAFEIENRLHKSLLIDGQEMGDLLSNDKIIDENILQIGKVRFYKTKDKCWTIKPPEQSLRARRQLGGVDAVLRSTGHFRIVYYGFETLPLALQISRNLFQYFSADAELVEGQNSTDTFIGNTIAVATGSSLPPAHLRDFPIQISNASHVLVRESGSSYKRRGSNDTESWAVFLRPSKSEALEVVVWGSTIESLACAARMTPFMTGIGQPDFVISDLKSRWKGVEASYLGFFNAEWEISRSSVLD